MLVLNVGGVVDLSPVKTVSNILLLSQLGVVTGDILADIILGKQNPSGKLATTWASIKDYKFMKYFGDINDINYKEGVYVGYRYFNSAVIKPLYPFGYGKSYTDLVMIGDSGSFDDQVNYATLLFYRMGVIDQFLKKGYKAIDALNAGKYLRYH
jgi:hypothetical protein